MKRYVIGGLLLLLLSAGVLWVVRLRPIYRSFYTDADTIKSPIASAPLREILWQPATTVPSGGGERVDEYEPRISADGSTLFFVRGKAGENADLYESQRDGVSWGEPRAVDGVNSDADELGPEPSIDGNTLYFYTNREGGPGGYDIWVAHRSSTGWEAPSPLERVNSPYNDYGAALSPDGRTLYFASNRPVEADPLSAPDGAAGVPSALRWSATLREDLTVRTYDLYAAALGDDGFAAPSPIAGLNTSHNEGAPAVSPFGDFLYFASDRPGGCGGFDLYRARRRDGGFRIPENLADALNSPANELDPALGMGGYRLYFSSDRRREDGADAAERRYALYVSTSREVFRDVEVEHRPPIAWATIWHAVAPWMLLAILALLGLLTLLALVRTFREKRVSLLTKCLVGSLLAHLALLFLFTVWQVSASIAEGIQRGGEIRVSLGAGGVVDALFAQLQGHATRVETPASEVHHPKLPAAMVSIEASEPMVTSATPLVLAADHSPSLSSDIAEANSPRGSPIRSTSAPLKPTDAPRPVSIAAPRTSAPRAVEEVELGAVDSVDAEGQNARRPQRDVETAPTSPLVTMSPGSLASVLPLDLVATRSAAQEVTESPVRGAPSTRRSARVDVPVGPPRMGDEWTGALRLDGTASRTGGDEPSIEATLAVQPVVHVARPSATGSANDEKGADVQLVRSAVTPVAVALEPATVSDREPVVSDAPLAHRLSNRTSPTIEGVDTGGGSVPHAENLRLPTAAPNFDGAALAGEPVFRTPPPSESPSSRYPESDGSRRIDAAGILDPPVLVTAVGALAAVADPAALGALSEPASEIVPRASAPRRFSANPHDGLEPSVFPVRTDGRDDAAAAGHRRDESTTSDAIAAMSSAMGAIVRAQRPQARPTKMESHPDGASVVSLSPLAESIVTGETVALAEDVRAEDRRRAAERVRRPALADPPPELPRDMPEVRSPEWPNARADSTDAVVEVRPDSAELVAGESRSGTIFGRVRDAESGAPIAGGVVRLEVLGGEAMAATADDRGEYWLDVSGVPDDFALSASSAGYVPSALNVRADALANRRLEVNFALRKLTDEVVVTEAVPELHHLGDNVFDGDINSQFQKASEGNSFETRFELSDRQVGAFVHRAELRMLVKGVQRRHGLAINGTLLTKRLSKAPQDGGFGDFVVLIQPELLRAGENTFRILCAAPVGGDYDDFEFVNVQIHLVLGVH